MWTLGKKVALGFAISFVLLLSIGTASFWTTQSLESTSQWVAHTHQVVEDLALLMALVREGESSQRGYVITADESLLESYRETLPRIAAVSKDLRQLTSDNLRQQRRLDRLEPLIEGRLAEMKKVIDLQRSNGTEEASKRIRNGDGRRLMEELHRLLLEMEGEERALLEERSKDVARVSALTRTTIVAGTLLSLASVVIAGLWIVRSLTKQIGDAVQHVQSSSAELQAAANQQLTGAKEQATAMTEITTTISELLATSRQIASSSQRVAQIAGETGQAAKLGDRSLEQTQDSVGAIKRQVDVIVTHMLELGRKSQQIGGILEIINELADQTNILAINATIEAAGAGEVGRRFAIVAEEIRKLADRVGGSTKEIRELVDDIRAAVNTTVMATEGGSKAVDAGTRQFGDVTQQFKQIANLVATTTDAAREIELSTKQQSTAVEQVNVAVANVAQAARENEASSGQTLVTSSQLTTLSRALFRMIQTSSTPQS